MSLENRQGEQEYHTCILICTEYRVCTEGNYANASAGGTLCGLIVCSRVVVAVLLLGWNMLSGERTHITAYSGIEICSEIYNPASSVR